MWIFYFPIFQFCEFPISLFFNFFDLQALRHCNNATICSIFQFCVFPFSVLFLFFIQTAFDYFAVHWIEMAFKWNLPTPPPQQKQKERERNKKLLYCWFYGLQSQLKIQSRIPKVAKREFPYLFFQNFILQISLTPKIIAKLENCLETYFVR